MTTFAIPPGIGDSAWALMVMQSIAKQHRDPKIDVRIGCWARDGHESRALDFVRRFSFVTSAEMYTMPNRAGQAGPWVQPGPQADENGINRYLPTGPSDLKGIDLQLVPNRSLEEGKRLEEWLPQYEVNWRVMDDWRFTVREVRDADTLASNLGPFVVFFMASLAGNTEAGHNRGPLWTPEQWVELGMWFRTFGLQVVVVGADWDRDYYDQEIAPRLPRDPRWHEFIGRWPIGMTYAVLRHAKVCVSYQSGIGIVAHYLGVPTVCWWRQKRPGHPEDSISPNSYVAHDERMASAWARPDAVSSGDLMPAIYGKHSLEDITTHVKRHWYPFR